MRKADVAPHVVIIGGGFGGLYAARELRRAPVRVTLIDRRNYHLFFPLLYQVATAGLNPADIATPAPRFAVLLRLAATGFVASLKIAAGIVLLPAARRAR